MKKRIGSAAVIMLLPVLLYGIVGPLEIYAGNPAEFNFGLRDFFPVFILISFAIWLAGSVLLAFLPQKIAIWLQAVICAFSFLSYAQNMFLNRELIRQDGTGMDWASLKGYTDVNLILWIILFAAIVLLPVILKKHYDKVYLYGSGFLAILQIVALTGLLVSVFSAPQKDAHYALSGEKQYTAASGQNTIVFILDHYSNGVFDACRENHPEMQDSLHDFTYYNNAECHYSFTFPSLAHMLTGTLVDCSKTPEEWEENCWKEEKCENFYKTLHDNGYECNFYSSGSVYSVLGNLAYLDGKFDNVVEAEPSTDHALLIRLFEKMTIYRYVPYLLKPRFETLTGMFQTASSYVVENDVEYENVAFYEAMKEHGITINEDTENAFTVIHLEGIHGPRTTTAEAAYTDAGLYEDEKEPTEEETARGLSIIITAYLEALKEAGVYDSAAIIITADHGDEEDPQPVFLLKKPNDTGEMMAETAAPVSHDDLQATILSMIGISDTSYGTSVFDWNDGDIRQRESWFPSEGFKIYTYETDREELEQKIQDGIYETDGADTGWKHSW